MNAFRNALRRDRSGTALGACRATIIAQTAHSGTDPSAFRAKTTTSLPQYRTALLVSRAVTTIRARRTGTAINVHHALIIRPRQCGTDLTVFRVQIIIQTLQYGALPRVFLVTATVQVHRTGTDLCVFHAKTTVGLYRSGTVLIAFRAKTIMQILHTGTGSSA